MNCTAPEGKVMGAGRSRRGNSHRLIDLRDQVDGKGPTAAAATQLARCRRLFASNGNPRF
jgi:hypothetical protein